MCESAEMGFLIMAGLLRRQCLRREGPRDKPDARSPSPTPHHPLIPANAGTQAGSSRRHGFSNTKSPKTAKSTSPLAFFVSIVLKDSACGAHLLSDRALSPSPAWVPSCDGMSGLMCEAKPRPPPALRRV